MEEERRQDEQAEDVKAGEAAVADSGNRLAAIVESILFAAGEPLTVRRIVEALNGPSLAEVRGALQRVAARYAQEDRGVRLVEVAGGYQLRTARENADWVRAVFRDRPRRLGKAGLETLAIVAYRGPVTKAEVEAIRGVDIDGVLGTLIRRGLVKVCGRKEAVGRPLLYGTTEEFLELFGLRNLSELPTLKELPEPAEVLADGKVTIEAAGSQAAEAVEPGGGGVAAQGGGVDSSREGSGGWAGGDGTRDPGGSPAAAD